VKEVSVFAIYVRVSEVGGREGESFGSPEEQEAKARAWAERNEVEVEDPTVELDVSGKTKASERELGRLIERCESGELEGIIVRYEDRFARDLIEGGVALDRLVECGARLVASESGFDSQNITPDKRMVFNILMSVGQAQREKNRLARITGAKRAAERGLHLANRAPFGYRFADRQKGGRRPSADGGIGRLEPDPITGAKVVEAFERRASGESFEKLGRFLGVKGKSSARAIIRNRVYVGEASVPTERKGQSEIIQNAHPPLVSEMLWERANGVGTRNFAPREGKWSALARLAGIARCAGCEKALSVGSNGGRGPYYACTAEGCPKRTGISAARLDAYVGNVLTWATMSRVPEVAAILEGDDRYQCALDAVEAAKKELDVYRSEIKVSDVGADQWKRDVATREVAVKIAREELKGVPERGKAYTGKVPVTAEQWAGASHEERVEIIEHAMDRDRLARFVDRVIVKPCGRGKRVPTVERAEVYFIGSETPASPLEPAVNLEEAAA
jgi:DNA invertase Pin-like site-specific DNA recombinase